jgi:hypothetical protein
MIGAPSDKRGEAMLRAVILFALGVFASSTVYAGSGWALSYSLDSFKEAKQLQDAQPQKHILIYYANAGR